jgi:hypothetical protein
MHARTIDGSPVNAINFMKGEERGRYGRGREGRRESEREEYQEGKLIVYLVQCGSTGGTRLWPSPVSILLIEFSHF